MSSPAPGPLRLQYSALSDVGRVRKDNQDSGYAGPFLLVIADGVGGAARGDVASSQTVEVLRRLDRPPAAGSAGGEDADVEASLGSLAATIHLCHDRISELVASQPELEGTSTTVTAVVFDGARIAVGHVGDSRGYLLREGTLAQLTTDHTFVQSLIDEGRITEDEARTHPHRNLILRAVDGVHEPQPDVFGLELAPGDRILLCSDGASGVLGDDELSRILADGPPDHAALSLVSRALDAGSTDNVTVVVADVVGAEEPEPTDSAAAVTGPMLVGAAAEGPRGLLPGVPVSDDTGELPTTSSEPSGRSTGTAASGGAEVDPEEARYAPRPPRRFLWLRRIAFLLVLALALGLIGFAGYRWSQDRYYVGAEGDQVVIFQGVELDLPGISLSSVYEETDLLVEDLPDAFARRVLEGVPADSLDAARNVVADYENQVSCPAPAPEEPQAQPDATASPDAQPSPSPEASPEASPGASPEASPSPSPSPSPTRVPAVCQERS